MRIPSRVGLDDLRGPFSPCGIFWINKTRGQKQKFFLIHCPFSMTRVLLGKEACCVAWVWRKMIIVTASYKDPL